MIMDIRLYSQTGVFQDYTKSSEIVESPTLGASASQGLEIIGNKVVKFLMTERGSDALDPEYGGTAMHILQMSETYLPKFRMELESDVRRCTAHIKASEKNLPADRERLSLIIVREVRYNPRLSPDRLDVFLEIVTDQSNRVLVALNKDM